MLCFKLFFVFLALLAVILNGMAAWRAWRFVRNTPPHRESAPSKPPATLLVPVRGIEGDGVEHFQRFCQLDWPSYQVVFTVLDEADPALPLLRRIRPGAGCEMTLQVGGRSEGANPKVRNLLNAFPKARHDWMAICDADVEVEPDFLDGLLLPMIRLAAETSPEKNSRDREIAMVHSLYRCRDATGGDGLAASWENVWINCDFWSQGLLGDWLRGTDFAFGAAMALHRSTLEQIGGLEAVRDYLADDYQIGHRVAALGKRLVFNRQFVTLRTKHQTWAETWRHLLRWNRTIRVCQPGGFAGSILTNATFFAVLSLMVDAHFFWLWSLTILLLRIVLANQCRNWILKKPGLWNRWWLILFKDLAHVILWLLAFRNGPIEWRDCRYRLQPDGKLTPV
ncbi:MAG: glycosyltransferase [Verrucomicrobia bacterium]|nr:glycosyltransferase [Verrucomicrobiota bacterium]